MELPPQYKQRVSDNCFDSIEDTGSYLRLTGAYSSILRGLLTPADYEFTITPKEIIVISKYNKIFRARLENNAKTLQLLRKYTSMDVENL